MKGREVQLKQKPITRETLCSLFWHVNCEVEAQPGEQDLDSQTCFQEKQNALNFWIFVCFNVKPNALSWLVPDLLQIILRLLVESFIKIQLIDPD